MPRSLKRQVVRSPDSGWQFVCHYCNNEVAQEALPALRWLVKKQGGVQTSESFQCCIDCAEEIDELNAKFQKRNPTPIRQVMPLRPDSELPPDVRLAKDEATKAAQNEAKLDKLVDAVGGLTAMMAQFMQMQMQKEIAEVSRPELDALLKTNAPSAPAQPEDKAEHANAKQKPRSARTTKPRSKRSR